MSEIKTLIDQVSLAANKIIARIHELDSQITLLDDERGRIVSEPISKSDLMEYVREDIKRRREFYPTLLRTKWAKDGRATNFPNHERIFEEGGVQAIPYLDGEISNPGIVFRSDAFYWFFGDLIADGFERGIEKLKWPEPGLPLKERRKKIQEIDAQIDALQEEREGLAAELGEAMPQA